MTVHSSSRCRIVVVGGGLTGLAAAHRLIELSRENEEAVEVILLEASERVGGVFGTEQVGDYTIETGADSFITNKPWAVDLVKRLGLEGELISPNPEFQRSLILHQGETIVTPVGFNLLAPSKVWPMLTTPLLSPSGKLRMACEYLIPRKRDDSDESLAAFVRRRFGQEMLDRIVQPMVGGIYTSDPERLSLKATLPRFVELEKEYGSLIKGLRRRAGQSKQDAKASGARYGLFATLKGGMSDLLNKLQSVIQENGTIRLSSKVTSLVVKDSGCVVQVNGEERIDADGVILALPAYISGKLLAPLNEELGERLSQIDYASSAIMVSGHRLEETDHPLDAFGLVIPHIEGRRILAVSFLSRKFPNRAPEGRVILRTFIGGAMQPEELKRSDEKVIETARSELEEILGFREEPEFVRLVRYNRAMPQYTVGHLSRVARIRELAAAFSNVGLAGNGFDGVGVPDCIHSGELAALSVWDSAISGSANRPS